MYGIIGYTHSNQVLRNIKFGAKTEVALEIADADGEFGLDKCVGVDLALAEACFAQKGEDGTVSVQAGLNDRAAAQMMEHEMQNIRQLAK